MNPIYRGILPPKNKTVFWMKGKKLLVYTPTGWKETSADITIDDSMVEGSENPVESKVIQQSLNAKQQALSLAINQKQNTLTIDTALSETSENPIENNAVYNQYMTNDDTADILEILGIYDYIATPLTLKAITSGNIIVKCESGYEVSMSYKKNNDDWVSFTSSTSGTSIAVTVGDKVQFKGSNSYRGHNTFSVSNGCTFNAFGNAYSLINPSGFATQTSLARSYALSYLFQNCTGLIEAKNLKLPATTLTGAEGCYSNMFAGCSNLTKGPELPQMTDLARNCYEYMFDGCSSLIKGPSVLSANVVGYQAYQYMFRNCSSLTKAPDILATLMSYSGCPYMFYGCTNLKSIKHMVSSYSNSNSQFTSWTYGVSATGTFTKNSACTNWATGTSGIPSGWTIVDAS